MVRGFVELIRPFQVRGWVIDIEAPRVRLEVTAALDGAEIATATADMFRSDLVGVAGGDGHHGFAINIPSELSETQQDRVTVVARAEGGSTPLARVVSKEATDTIATAVPSATPPASAITSGWSGEDRSQRPVFVLGAARSGTSALAQGLMGATRYRGHGEGHLLDIIPSLLGVVEQHYRDRGEEWSTRPTMIADVPQMAVTDGCRHVMIEIIRKVFPDGYWLDKTPRHTMTSAIPEFRKIWPNARFVFMKRRGIENVGSRLRKFGAVPFTRSCEDWSRSMRDWLPVSRYLSGVAIEIDQLTLATEPGRVAEALGLLLELRPWEVHRLKTAFANDRPEQTNAAFDKPRGFEGVDWSAEEKEEFRSICGGMMEQFGYSYGSDYYRGGSGDAGLRVI